MPSGDLYNPTQPLQLERYQVQVSNLCVGGISQWLLREIGMVLFFLSKCADTTTLKHVLVVWGVEVPPNQLPMTPGIL